MSRLFLFNFCVAQWFGIRRARIIDTETGKQIGWTWVRMKPLQGWGNDR